MQRMAIFIVLIVIACGGCITCVTPPPGMDWEDVRRVYPTQSWEMRDQLLRLYWTRVWRQPIAAGRVRGVIVDEDDKAYPTIRMVVGMDNMVRPWNWRSREGKEYTKYLKDGHFDVIFGEYQNVRITFYTTGWRSVNLKYERSAPYTPEEAERLLLRKHVIPLDDDSIGFRIVIPRNEVKR